ncbi:MAG TPA: hypothetical protein VFD92_12500 [Candidatus Binatia bacterium]|nr:hypothetical protein [Candidatus Binatia bacterium]
MSAAASRLDDATAARLDELVARLPGAIRRGHAPDVRAREAECAPTGIAELDEALGGGFPRGRLSELRGRGSAGLTSVAQRAAGRATARGDLVAWIDAPDALDPESAAASGIALDRLLWIRAPDLLAAFAAGEQILALGGFPLVVLDAGLPYRATPEGVRVERLDEAVAARRASRFVDRRTGRARASAAAWVRLARAAARSRSALVVLVRGDDAGAGTSAAVRLELPPARVVWDRAHGAPPLLDGLQARIVIKRNRGASGERALAVALA